MSRAVLSIGSNIGDRLGYLQLAVDHFRPYLTAVSPVFETAPWGPVEQQSFLNAILICVDGEAGPDDWLARGQSCEQSAGRTRELHWGPRSLDVDVIVVDELVSDDPRLTLPHPHAHERAFVLVPWWAADPEAQLPGRGSVLSLLQGLPEGEADQARLRLDLALHTDRLHTDGLHTDGLHTESVPADDLSADDRYSSGADGRGPADPRESGR